MNVRCRHALPTAAAAAAAAAISLCAAAVAADVDGADAVSECCSCYMATIAFRILSFRLYSHKSIRRCLRPAATSSIGIFLYRISGH